MHLDDLTADEQQANKVHGFSTAPTCMFAHCLPRPAKRDFEGALKPNKQMGFMVGAQGIEPWTSPV
jgi:hypothetical protein